MRSDGTDVRQLTVNDLTDADPAWSPDGTQIAFARIGHDGKSEIYTMWSDGTDVRQLTLNDAWDGNPLGPPNAPRSASPTAACLAERREVIITGRWEEVRVGLPALLRYPSTVGGPLVLWGGTE